MTDHDPPLQPGDSQPPDQPVPPGMSPVPAAPAQPLGAGGQPPKKKNTALIVILVVVGLLLLCGIASCVGGLALFSTMSDEIEGELDSIEAEFDPDATADDDGTGEGDTDDGSADAATLAKTTGPDVQRMVSHFYPWFTPDSFYVVDADGGPGGAATYHVVAAYNNDPGFRITFFAYRATSEASAEGVEAAQVFFDEEAGVWWVHPQTRENSLDYTFGPDALMVEPMLDQIAADFTAAHPDALVTRVFGMTNVDLGFAGIFEDDIDAWLDDFESFESTWKLDMQTAPSSWYEIDYQEF